ncbi:hypothetical protein ACGFNU_21190 [Spirillospora sp. NPDC048911]|uniref:hypothetical protein n=1 Tax=Spirillospora sp. NPDC048911 TaxID=3364527 RepID=UPI00371AA26D
MSTMAQICPNGHELGPGRVLEGWAPCGCPPALGAFKGHRTTQCEICRAEGFTTVRYVPEHIGDTLHPSR